MPVTFWPPPQSLRKAVIEIHGFAAYSNWRKKKEWTDDQWFVWEVDRFRCDWKRGMVGIMFAVSKCHDHVLDRPSRAELRYYDGG